MLFKKEETQDFLSRLNKYREDVTSAAKDSGDSDGFGYVFALIDEVQKVISEVQQLSVSVNEGDFFDNYREKILRWLAVEVKLKSLAEIHFEYAIMLRRLTVMGNGEFNNHDVVDFYLNPRYPEIARYRIDCITFEIPAEFYSRGVKKAAEAIGEQYKAVCEWREEVGALEDRVRDSEQRYNNVLHGNNYLGLAHAFLAIISKKTEEAENLRLVVVSLAIAAFIVPCLQFFFGNHIFAFEEINLPTVSASIFAIALEVLIVYYFRICYQRWSNIKTQIHQFELRHAMCAFVQDYAEKSKELDRGTLAKFENMIFAEVTADSVAPPSVYDAIDSIAKVLAAWKRPS